MLRCGLGNAYLRAGDTRRAVEHLQMAVRSDPGYSAAWKMLGKALTAAGRVEDACAAYAEGIRVAEGKRDIQAAREMKVFLKRLQKN